jgi:lysozyme family protein
LKSNYAACLDIVLGYEGGFANHPDDPGGATMRGVTQRTYDAWRKSAGLPSQSVERIGESELQAFYRSGYWDKVCGDDLPPGVDLAVFDLAVNSGPMRAAKMLQDVVDAEPDGIIGPATLAAVKARDAAGVVTLLCSDRLDFLQGLPHWPTFKNGWRARVRGIEASALKMVDAPPKPASKPLPSRPGPLSTTGAPPLTPRAAWPWILAGLVLVGIFVAIFH